MKKIHVGLLLLSLCFPIQSTFAEETNIVHTDVVKKTIPEYTIQIATPTSEQTFQNEAQSIAVTVNVVPKLEDGDSIILYVDGKECGEPTATTTLTTPWLERGSHTLQAKIIQPKGKGAESELITIYQQRTSKLLPPK